MSAHDDPRPINALCRQCPGSATEACERDGHELEYAPECERCGDSGEILITISHWDDDRGSDSETDYAECPAC